MHTEAANMIDAAAKAAARRQTSRQHEPVDERRLFRSRIIRCFRAAPVPRFSRLDLKEVLRATRRPWHETEFQLMVRDGVLVRDTGDYGDENLFVLREGLL